MAHGNVTVVVQQSKRLKRPALLATDTVKTFKTKADCFRFLNNNGDKLLYCCFSWSEHNTLLFCLLPYRHCSYAMTLNIARKQRQCKRCAVWMLLCGGKCSDGTCPRPSDSQVLFWQTGVSYFWPVFIRSVIIYFPQTGARFKP